MFRTQFVANALQTGLGLYASHCVSSTQLPTNCYTTFVCHKLALDFPIHFSSGSNASYALRERYRCDSADNCQCGLCSVPGAELEVGRVPQCMCPSDVRLPDVSARISLAPILIL